mmetsp:Transcript_9843/g.41866  ORF Transcript_9843/g.41866 Transcript_9843/m.41866 type:complete len:302 (-) Transcript_9843:118-1023(-)
MRARGLACAARLLARGDATTAPARWMGIASAFRVDPPAANAPWSLDAKRHASRWPFPKSGGVEGFPDQYMRTIKKRVVPANGTEAPPPVEGVFYGDMPDVGVERHLRGLSDETKSALETILDIEHAPSDVVLPSMSSIDAEETESQRLKAERKALLADEQEKQRASRVSVRDRFGRSGATGKRKTAVARVTLWPGVGDVTCNSKPLDESFPDIDHRGWMIKPFLVTNTMGLFDVRAIVRGGGKSGQAQAVRHGIAKALQLYEPAFRPALKKAGMLTRDPRVVERKKPGRKKARKAFQWVKR